VGGNGMGHRFNPFRPFGSEHLAGYVCADEGVVAIGACFGSPAHVVEQSRGAHNLLVSSFHVGQSFREGQHPKNVVKIVYGVGAGVQSPRLLNRDHDPPRFDPVRRSRRDAMSARSWRISTVAWI
jgi:hypothetical protein